MIKRIIPFALLGAAFISNTGCKSGGGDFKKLKGIEYKIVKDAPGKTAAMGDVMELHLYAKVDTVPGQALVLADTRKQMDGKPVPERVQEVKEKGQFQAVFAMLSAGDSAVVHVSCDTLLATLPENAKQNLPSWLKKGNTIEVTVSVVSVKPAEEYQKEAQAKQEEMMREMKEKEAQQMPADDKMLQEYFTKNNIKAEKTASGLYYTIVKKGSGANAKPGQMVSMNYVGKTLEGKQFDANTDDNFKPLPGKQVFTFPLGQGQVIKGWDEGVALLNKGSRAKLFIPSPLAYGAQAMGPELPANSILVFDVEVVDIKDAPPQQQQQPMPQAMPNQ